MRKPKHAATTAVFWMPGGTYKTDVCEKCGKTVTCKEFWHTPCSLLQTLRFLFHKLVKEGFYKTGRIIHIWY